MKTITTNALLLSKKEIWFNNNDQLDAIEADVIEYKESLVNQDNHLTPFKNGVVDISRSCEKISASFDKKFIYEINRASRESITGMVLHPSDAIDEVYHHYEYFCRSKGLSVIKLNAMKRYVLNQALHITAASIAGNLLQYHMYFFDTDEAVLLASFPNRNKSLEGKFYGWGNRLLHWHDILYFKEAGCSRYNLGGIGNPPTAENMNIIKFKMEMAPEIMTYYHGTIYRGLKGKISLVKGLVKGIWP